jgi:hypothetical protein
LWVLRQIKILPKFNEITVVKIKTKANTYSHWFLYLADQLRDSQETGCENRRIRC